MLAMIKSTYVGRPKSETQTNITLLENIREAYQKQKAESFQKPESLLSSCLVSKDKRGKCLKSAGHINVMEKKIYIIVIIIIECNYIDRFITYSFIACEVVFTSRGLNPVFLQQHCVDS